MEDRERGSRRFGNFRERFFLAWVAFGLFGGGLTAVSLIAYGDGAELPAPPDNSQANARDNSPAAVTADQQSSKTSDLELTRKIRQAVVAEPDLSVYGQNVKIVTVNGVVTLKGPVETATEKAKIASIAREIAGKARVKNEIDVAHH